MTRLGRLSSRLLTEVVELTDEAFADLLKKHKQQVGLKATLKESVSGRSKRKR
jgi:hypothetical protein